ncbi:MAG: hypothetical protein HOW97_10565 [Catenulispora sp.]|nr:hypothetical protein [Catenulispora sp.]
MIHPSSLLLDALIALFEAEWRLALAIPQGSEAGPDEEKRALLSLLASGQTDEAIAPALGWSFRTTQRRVQALMRSLDVTTRFQVGMEARGRGWVWWTSLGMVHKRGLYCPQTHADPWRLAPEEDQGWPIHVPDGQTSAGSGLLGLSAGAL